MDETVSKLCYKCRVGRRGKDGCPVCKKRLLRGRVGRNRQRCVRVCVR